MLGTSEACVCSRVYLSFEQLAAIMRSLCLGLSLSNRLFQLSACSLGSLQLLLQAAFFVHEAFQLGNKLFQLSQVAIILLSRTASLLQASLCHAKTYASRTARQGSVKQPVLLAGPCSCSLVLATIAW